MKEKNRYLLGAGLLILSVALIFAGVHRGEMGVVLRNAASICFACIGIG